MSRRAAGRILAAALLSLPPLLTAAPVKAQGDAPKTKGATAEQVLSTARKSYGPPAPEQNCRPQKGDEIVVCAGLEDHSAFRVKSTADLDPNSKQALDDGVPHAPDVAGEYIFRGKGIGGGCFLSKCPPPPAIFVDVEALPTAPEGSDADRIARGLPAQDDD
ncbi:MAG: hypothetical protein H6918_02275 [Sphingomonadaceae bacterium]|nr:hypothetical protein [Sphingomonadaceae bacterium]